MIKNFKEINNETFVIANTRGKKFLPIFMPYSFLKALFLIKTHRITHLHLSDGLISPEGILLKKLTGVKTIATIHGLDITHKPRIYQKIIPASIRKLDGVICVSNYTKNECIKRNMLPEKCKVIPNGIDEDLFFINLPKSELKEQLAKKIHIQPGSKKILLTNGRLVERKGIAWFVDSVMPKIKNDFIYLISGDGPERENIKKTIKKNKLENCVIMLGRTNVETLKLLYNASDLFILPNIHIEGNMEGFGIVVLEAGSCGLPVIASDIEGIKDAVINGKTGWLVESENSEAFIKKIESSSFDPKSIQKIVRYNFNWTKIAQQYLDELNYLGSNDINRNPNLISTGKLHPTKGINPCTKLKVLIVATGYPRRKDGFANVYLHRLAKSLVKKGIEIHVVAPHDSGIKKEEEFDGVKIHRFQYFPEKYQSLAYFPGIPEKIKTAKGKAQLPFFMLTMFRKINYVIKKYDLDLVNAHWAMPTGFIAALAKKTNKKPILITLYGAELWPALKKNSKIMKSLASYAINNADAVVGISDATCKAGKQISGRENIEILPDGIDIKKFNPSINANEVKKKYGRFLFSSGRMVERKGFIYLVRAMPNILKDFPDIKLVMSGEGPEKENLKKEAKKLAVKDSIIFPGFISEVDFPKYMKAAKVFVLPSIVDSKGDTEGSATILLEAMACGTPVVGTKVGGVPYAIKDGIGGYLVGPKNPGQLAEKIVCLLKSENGIGKIGSRYVKENFDTDRIAGLYLEKFEEIFSKQPKKL